MSQYIYTECAITFGTVKAGTGKQRKTADAVYITAWDGAHMRFRCAVPLPDKARSNHAGFSMDPGGCNTTMYNMISRLVTSVRTLYLPIGSLEAAVVSELKKLLRSEHVLPDTACARQI